MNTIKNLCISAGITVVLLGGLITGTYLFKFVKAQHRINNTIIDILKINNRVLDDMHTTNQIIFKTVEANSMKIEGSLQKSNVTNDQLLCMINEVNKNFTRNSKQSVDFKENCL